METAETTPGRDDLRARIAAAYAPFVALCRLLEHRLREQPDDRSPVGWAPYLEALRALRDGGGGGDWDRLAELMVAPDDLPELPDGRDAIQTAADAPYACLIDIRDPLKGAVTFRELVRALTKAGRRVL